MGRRSAAQSIGHSNFSRSNDFSCDRRHVGTVSVIIGSLFSCRNGSAAILDEHVESQGLRPQSISTSSKMTLSHSRAP
jgi:hypothetical protein